MEIYRYEIMSSTMLQFCICVLRELALPIKTLHVGVKLNYSKNFFSSEFNRIINKKCFFLNFSLN